jgi:hypothetical protein
MNYRRRLDWTRRRAALACLLAALCVANLSCTVSGPPVLRALYFLLGEQDFAVQRAALIGSTDFEGNWPQFFFIEGAEAGRIVEVSPFMPSFIHHSLSLLVEENAEALGLARLDLVAARGMRTRAVEFMQQFAARPGDADAGTFAFWPHAEDPDAEPTLLQFLALEFFIGPTFFGSRMPVNLDFYPPEMAVPSDADDTAAIYSALMDHHFVDGGAPVDPSVAQFFADWRDLGGVPLRRRPSWQPFASGAYLTWLDYRAPGEANVASDVDLPVNANVLLLLGRLDALDTPGVDEAVALINAAVAAGYHRSRPSEASNYYPDNYALHYLVSRAYHEGGVDALAPAVAILADDVESEAIVEEGLAHWDKGDPHLNTAFALLTLMNAGRVTPQLDQGVAYLVAEQDPLFGNWDEGTFFVGNMISGDLIRWVSKSFTTSLALEALARYELLIAGH